MCRDSVAMIPTMAARSRTGLEENRRPAGPGGTDRAMMVAGRARLAGRSESEAAMVLAAVILHQRPTLLQVTGALLVCGGGLIVARAPPQRASQLAAG